MSADLARGGQIKARRLALGIDTMTAFAEATGRDRGTLGRAEEGIASASTLDWIEAWLTRQEHEGMTDPVELALVSSDLPVWRQHAVLAEYHRHRQEQEQDR